MRKTSRIPDPSWEDIHDRDNMIAYLCRAIDKHAAKSWGSIAAPEDVDRLEKAAAKARKAL